jgi:hypothetical protein
MKRTAKAQEALAEGQAKSLAVTVVLPLIKQAISPEFVESLHLLSAYWLTTALRDDVITINSESHNELMEYLKTGAIHNENGEEIGTPEKYQGLEGRLREIGTQITIRVMKEYSLEFRDPLSALEKSELNMWKRVDEAQRTVLSLAYTMNRLDNAGVITSIEAARSVITPKIASMLVYVVGPIRQTMNSATGAIDEHDPYEYAESLYEREDLYYELGS